VSVPHLPQLQLLVYEPGKLHHRRVKLVLGGRAEVSLNVLARLPGVWLEGSAGHEGEVAVAAAVHHHLPGAGQGRDITSRGLSSGYSSSVLGFVN